MHLAELPGGLGILESPRKVFGHQQIRPMLRNFGYRTERVPEVLIINKAGPAQAVWLQSGGSATTLEKDDEWAAVSGLEPSPYLPHVT